MPSPNYQAVSHSSGTATSFTATEPTGTVSGDKLLLLVFLDTNPSGWTPPALWVEKGATGGTTVTGGGQTFQAYIYAIERGASAPALGGSWTGSHYYEWTIIRLDGALSGGSAAFVESVTSTAPGAGTTCDSPSTAPLTANSLAFTFAWCWAGFSGSEATPAGYNLVQQTAFLGNTQAWKQLSTTAAEDPPAWGALGSSTAIWANTVIIASVAVGGPTITAQPSDQQVASGSTATFTATATASGGGSLSWQAQLNGSNVSGATGSGGSASYMTGTLGYSDDLGVVDFVFTETGGTSPGSTTTATAKIYVGTRVVGASTPVYSTSGGTSVAPSYSTLPAIQAGDEIVLIVAQKPSAANGGTVTTPSGYAIQGSLTGAGGYGATLANNTGNTNLFVYAKTATGSESGALTVAVGTNGVCSAFFVLLRPIAGSTVSYAFASGSDTTAGNVSIACGSDPGEAPGDVVLQVFNGSSQLILPFSAQAIATTGVTYGTVSEVAEYGTTVGNDVAGYVAAAKAVSGTSSAAPTFTATVGGTNTNARGPGVVLRMRAASGGTNTPMTISATQSQTASRARALGAAKGVTQVQAAAYSRALAASKSSSSTQSPSHARALGRTRSGTQAQTPTAAEARNFARTLSGTEAQSPARVLSLGLARSSSSSQAPSAARAVGATKSASSSQTPSRARAVAPAAKSATEAQAPSLIKGQGYFRTASATATQAASRALALARTLAATEAGTPSLGPRAVLRALSATTAQAASRARAVGRALSAVQAQAGSSDQQQGGGSNHPMTLSATAAQAVSYARALARALSSAAAQAPTFVRAVAQAPKAATQVQAPAVARAVSPSPRSAVQTQAPSAAKGANRAVNASATSAQTPSRRYAFGFVRQAVAAQAPTVARGLARALVGFALQTGTAARGYFRSFFGVVVQTGSEVHGTSAPTVVAIVISLEALGRIEVAVEALGRIDVRVEPDARIDVSIGGR